MSGAQANGHWSLIDVGAGERVMIEPLAVELDVDEVYRIRLRVDPRSGTINSPSGA